VREDDEGALWIDTKGDGLDRMKDGKVERFGLGQGLSKGRLWSVLRDRGGVVWAGMLLAETGTGSENDPLASRVGGRTQNWAPLALSDGQLLIRDQTKLKCIAVAQ
jgi:hypothetical protein